MEPERRLWRAVVAQAVVDATADITGPVFFKWALKRARKRRKKGLEMESRPAVMAAWADRAYGSKASTTRAERERGEASRFLLGITPGLETVCQLAGYDPRYILRKARMLKSGGWKAIIAPELIQAA